MTKQKLQTEEKRPTTVISFPEGEVRTSPEMAKRYLQEMQFPVTTRNLSDPPVDETHVSMGNGDVMNLSHPNAERDLTSLFGAYDAQSIKIDSLSKNTGIYDNARKTVLGYLSNIGLAAGAACMLAGIIYQDAQMLGIGAGMALPGAAYRAGRYEESQSLDLQKRLLLKKVRSYQAKK